MYETEEQLKRLSEDQREIYKHLAKGTSVEEIAEIMNRSKAIISAQKTRIINKGVKLPDSHRVLPKQSRQEQRSSQPASTGHSSNKQVMQAAEEAGPAEYDIDQVIAELQKQGKVLNRKDVHPMVMLGVTFQFMKMAGGRMHAHQLIEDVYSSLRLLVNDGKFHEVPGVTTETKPWPPGGEELTAEELVQQFRVMQENLEKMLRS